MEPTIPKYQLAELEDVGGSGSRDDESEMAKWVSEACVRTLIIGLLDMLSYKDNVSIEQVSLFYPIIYYAKLSILCSQLKLLYEIYVQAESI